MRVLSKGLLNLSLISFVVIISSVTARVEEPKDKTEFDVLIVGAGISGSSVADILASKGYTVLVIDQRNHIAGNCYDYVNEYGIQVHKYGPHMFHTNNEDIWKYVTSKGPFRHFEYFIYAMVDEQPVPLPVNRVTINMLYKQNLKTEEEVDEFLKKETAEFQNINITNSEELILKTFGRKIYQSLYEGYNKKMWKMPATKLSAAVSARIPWRKNDINRYFDDIHQAVPVKSYTSIVESMLKSDNINVILNQKFEDLDNKYKFKKVYYTGPIDALCHFSHGTLPYLSLNITFKTFEEPLKALPSPSLNYPNDQDFHRLFEAKWLNPSFSNYTTLSYEKSTYEGEPYYAIPNTTNHIMYKKYKSILDKAKRVVVYGRLGDYRYYNMDIALSHALKKVEDTYEDIKNFQPVNREQVWKELKETCDSVPVENINNGNNNGNMNNNNLNNNNLNNGNMNGNNLNNGNGNNFGSNNVNNINNGNNNLNNGNNNNNNINNMNNGNNNFNNAMNNNNNNINNNMNNNMNNGNNNMNNGNNNYNRNNNYNVNTNTNEFKNVNNIHRGLRHN